MAAEQPPYADELIGYVESLEKPPIGPPDWDFA